MSNIEKAWELLNRLDSEQWKFTAKNFSQRVKDRQLALELIAAALDAKDAEIAPKLADDEATWAAIRSMHVDLSGRCGLDKKCSGCRQIYALIAAAEARGREDAVLRVKALTGLDASSMVAVDRAALEELVEAAEYQLDSESDDSFEGLNKALHPFRRESKP